MIKISCMVNYGNQLPWNSLADHAILPFQSPMTLQPGSRADQSSATTTIRLIVILIVSHQARGERGKVEPVPSPPYQHAQCIRRV